MASLQTICVRTLRQTLLTYSATIASLVGDRIYWEYAPEEAQFPYVIITHISGGEDNETQSRACDVNFKIVGQSNDKNTTRLLSDAIADGLVDRFPDTTGIPEALGYTTIEEIIPVFDIGLKQNVEFYSVGGIYRIRLSLERIT